MITRRDGPAFQMESSRELKLSTVQRQFKFANRWLTSRWRFFARTWAVFAARSYFRNLGDEAAVATPWRARANHVCRGVWHTVCCLKAVPLGIGMFWERGSIGRGFAMRD